MRYNAPGAKYKNKEANFYILRRTRMPAMLSENGFFTNLEECKKMLQPSWQRKIADLHVDAILRIERSGI